MGVRGSRFKLFCAGIGAVSLAVAGCGGGGDDTKSTSAATNPDLAKFKQLIRDDLIKTEHETAATADCIVNALAGEVSAAEIEVVVQDKPVPKSLVQKSKAAGKSCRNTVKGGSGGGATISTASIAKQLTKSVAQSGAKGVKAHCPAKVPAKAGTTFKCQMKDSEGGHAPATVTLKDATGKSFSYKVATSGGGSLKGSVTSR